MLVQWFPGQNGTNADSLLSKGTSSWLSVNTWSVSQCVSRFMTKQMHWVTLVIENYIIQARTAIQFSWYFGPRAFPWLTSAHFLCLCLPASDLESVNSDSHVSEMLEVNNPIPCVFLFYIFIYNCILHICINIYMHMYNLYVN